MTPLSQQPNQSTDSGLLTACLVIFHCAEEEEVRGSLGLHLRGSHDIYKMLKKIKPRAVFISPPRALPKALEGLNKRARGKGSPSLGPMERRSSASAQIPKVPHQITQVGKQMSMGPRTSRQQDNRQSPPRNQAGSGNATCSVPWGSQSPHLSSSQV